MKDISVQSSTFKSVLELLINAAVCRANIDISNLYDEHRFIDLNDLFEKFFTYELKFPDLSNVVAVVNALDYKQTFLYDNYRKEVCFIVINKIDDIGLLKYSIGERIYIIVNTDKKLNLYNAFKQASIEINELKTFETMKFSPVIVIN